MVSVEQQEMLQDIYNLYLSKTEALELIKDYDGNIHEVGRKGFGLLGNK